MKNFAKKIIVICKPIIISIFALFFEKRFLVGRHFDDGFAGYTWAARAIWQRHLLRLAPTLPFPTTINCHVANSRNIEFHPDDLNNFQTGGTYFQNMHGSIFLGKGSYIAPNVGIITANHNPLNLAEHLPAENVVIGENCWIGMNSVILPGVILGERTIVAAGSIVKQSFPEGFCVIAGAPARKVKDLSKLSIKMDNVS